MRPAPAALVAATLLAALGAAALLGPGHAAADWRPEAVQKVQEKLKAGKNFNEDESSANRQIVRLLVGASGHDLEYVLDLRAQLCFVRGIQVAEARSLTLVPCANLKRGYPDLAPFITWEP